MRRFAVTGSGNFGARLVRMTLRRLMLSAISPTLGFIAFLQVPADRILIALVNRAGGPLIWGGTQAGTDRLVTLGPGERVHVRADGPSNWGMIWLPLVEFTHYAAALTGQEVTVPGRLAIRPLQARQSKEFHDLHAAAIKSKISTSDPIMEAEASHGLEQQLIHQLIARLTVPPLNTSDSSPPQLIELAARFEEFVLTERDAELGVPQISRALGVSTRLLERSCASQLGMGPSMYLRLCRRDRGKSFGAGIGYKL